MESHTKKRRVLRATRDAFHGCVPREKLARTRAATLHGAISLFVVLFLLVPLAAAGAQTVVLKYSDFGPPSLAWKTIGMDWWQWDKHGDPDPRSRCNIHVVVYRGIPLESVKRMYPVRKEINQDFRYLEYSKALEYLDKAIKETQDDELSILRKLAQELRTTRRRILDGLGGPQEDDRGHASRK